jgi:hypothetical protein
MEKEMLEDFADSASILTFDFAAAEAVVPVASSVVVAWTPMSVMLPLPSSWIRH